MFVFTMNLNGSNERKLTHTKKKPRSKLYPAEIIIDANYEDDLVFLTNTPGKNWLVKYTTSNVECL